MSVYVDDYNAKFKGFKMSHMIADTEQELDDMAVKIGLETKWKQKGWCPHYDVSLSKKKLALQNGAKEVTTRQLAKIMIQKLKQLR